LTSKTIRLERVYKGAVYKSEIGQLQLPLKSASASARDLVEAIQDLLPEPEGPGA
jgi:hypothetical protein